MMPSTIIWDNVTASALSSNPAIQSDWNRLNAIGSNLPFHDASAAIASLEFFGSGKERLLVGSCADRTVAMFLLTPTKSLTWQTFQPSQIPLGLWIAEPQWPLDKIADDLLRALGGLNLALSITQIDSRFSPRMEDSNTLRSTDYIDTGWIDIGDSFDDYWNARGKNLKQNMRKQRRKFEADNIDARTRKITRADDIRAALERYGAIESAGWKGSQGTAIKADNAQGKFYFRLLHEAATRGEAVIYEYYFNERPVAMNLCLMRNRTLTILKTTYDESTQPYSPAQLLMQDILEELHQGQQTARIEFYGRMMEWHTRWTESKRTLYHLTCFRLPLIKKIVSWRKARRPN